MNNLKTLEEALNIPVTEWTSDKILHITEDDNLFNMLDKETVAAICESDILPEISSIFDPINLRNYVYNIQSNISTALSNYEEDTNSDKLLSFLKEYSETDDVFYKFYAYLSITGVFPDNSYLTEKEDDIRKTVNDLIVILRDMNIKYAYLFLCDMLNFLFTLIEGYFKATGIKLIENNEDLNKMLAELNAYSEELNATTNTENMIDPNMRPEDYGFIDVTKKNEPKGGK